VIGRPFSAAAAAAALIMLRRLANTIKWANCRISEIKDPVCPWCQFLVKL